ncbi:PTS-dependent dihydroxyacetone kinase 1, dihydroxyacetone-binding subunit DhaK-like [Euwallacea fornicatus]|uniref:PTS-dependent dihydroxyacetone kinase 1, dihydroxyacetone-binding subunit DhaK-like n=1 Tax=Euwallacea fornicatus TaxID=995702 RepID=UPI00338EEECB
MDKPLEDQLDPYIKGYASYNQAVSLFEFGEVIVMKNYKENMKVRILSGGSSCHIEYVGTGMLTASIQGKWNKPPVASLILRTIRELSINHEMGILLVGQGNLNDILNFGLAVERALNDGLKVTFLGIFDDCRNNHYSKRKKRGLSGIVLVNKIAGALAIQDKQMSEIVEYCSKVISNITTIGVSIKNMLGTNQECLSCIKTSMVENNASTYRKTNLKKLTVMDMLSDTTQSLLAEIIQNQQVPLSPGDNIIVLVNNIGALNTSEQCVFMKHCLNFFGSLDIQVVKFYIGHYLQLNYDVDLSVTILKVFDKAVVNLLEVPCNVTGWRPVFQDGPIPVDNNIMPAGLKQKCRLSPSIKGPKLSERVVNIVQLCLHFACNALISCEKMLNTMDAERGDGDTGTRLRILAEVLNKRSCDKKLNFVYPFTFFLTLSKLLENTVGGTMGCIYSIMFEAAANTFAVFPEDEEIRPEMWIKALENSRDALKRYGNVNFGEKTMYDPLATCADLIRRNSTQGRLIYAFEMGVGGAEDIAQSTKPPGAKFPDAGAHAIGIWMRAVCEAVKLRCMD